MESRPYPSARKERGSASCARLPHSMRIVSAVAISAPNNPRLLEASPSEARKRMFGFRWASKSFRRLTKVTSERSACSQPGRVVRYYVQVVGIGVGGSVGARVEIVTGMVYLLGSSAWSTGIASSGMDVCSAQLCIKKARTGCLGCFQVRSDTCRVKVCALSKRIIKALSDGE
jgi:hypothetical protein